MAETKKKTINEFIDNNMNLMSLIGIFFIFLTVGGNFLNESSDISAMIRYGGILLLTFLLINLLSRLYSNDYSNSVQVIFGFPLILISFPLIAFIFFAPFFAQNKILMDLIVGLPGAILTALAIFSGAILVLLANYPPKLKKWRYLTNLLVLILLACLGIFSDWKKIWFGTKFLSPLGWMFHSIIIGYILTIINAIKNKKW